MTINFEQESLTEIIKNFYYLTGIKIVVFNDRLDKIASYPKEETPFCLELKKNPTFSSKCKECTQSACKLCKDTGKINIYRCHAGLIEAVSPIYVDNTIIGYIMLGQVVSESDSAANKKKIIEYASKYTDNAKNISSSLIFKSEKYIQSAIKIMESCACYIIFKNLIKINRPHLANDLGDYIEQNLSLPITIDSLCEKFSISRNTLYKLFQENYNITVAKYIKKLRIAKAKRLIEDGLSVTQAAFELGFSDYSYFSKVFKSEMGMLPSKFKQTSI